jgi:PAS domain S-box-containing protein
LTTAALAVCYFLTAKLGLAFAIPPGKASAVWPPSGIALGAVLLLGYRVWPGIWVGAAIANISVDLSGPAVLSVATGNTLEAILFAWLFNRFLSVDGIFQQVQEAFYFALMAAASCVVAASVGAASLLAIGQIQGPEVSANWWTWWLGDLAGLMILAPLILTNARSSSWKGRSAAWWIELCLGFLLLVIVSQCVFGDWLPEHLAANLVYVTLLFLIWICLRFDLAQVTLATTVLTIAAVWGTSAGLGAYGKQAVNEAIFDLHVFTNIFALTGLALAGVVTKRRQAESALRKSHEELERKVQTRTAELQAANLELRGEVAERKLAEAELEVARKKLERRVVQQSADLTASQEQLQREIAARDRLDQWFRQVLESSPDALAVSNSGGEIVLVNEAMERLFGYSASELIGQPIEILIPERHRERHEDLRTKYHRTPFSRMMGTGNELSARRKDGSVFPAEIALGPMKTDEGVFVFSAIRDVTARKVAERALRDSEQRFELALQGSDAGIWDWNLKENVVYFSPRWKSMLGYGENEIADDFSEWESRLHPEDRELAKQRLEAYLAGESPEYEFEHRLLHRDGTYRWILSRGAAVRDESGTPYRMVGSHLDVTARKYSEEVYRNQEAQLIAAEEIQRHLLPQSAPTLAGFEIAAECYPAEFAAGDHYDYLYMDDGSLVLIVSDVCGHGVGPAILMASLAAHIRSFAEAHGDVSEILNKANSMLVRESSESRFVTLVAARIDPVEFKLEHVTCGHPPGIILNAAGELKAELGGKNLPLGILPDLTLHMSGPISLEEGDVILFVTDGILETASPAGVQFGSERTMLAFRDNRDKPAAEIVEALHRAACDHAGTSRLADDGTLAVIKVVAGAAESPRSTPAT